MGRPFIKFITDFGPLLIFFIIYFKNDQNLKIAIPPFIAATLFALAICYFLERRIPFVPLTSGIITVVFGPYYMSMLFGIVFFSHQIGSFLGSWLGGKFFDTYGSYDIMWWSCVILGFASALIHFPIKEIAVPRLSNKKAVI